MLTGLHVEHELAERPLEPGELTLENHEPGARHAHGRLEIHETEARAQVDVILGVVDGERLAPAVILDVGALVLADGYVRSRDVGQAR